MSRSFVLVGSNPRTFFEGLCILQEDLECIEGREHESVDAVSEALSEQEHLHENSDWIDDKRSRGGSTFLPNDFLRCKGGIDLHLFHVIAQSSIRVVEHRVLQVLGSADDEDLLMHFTWFDMCRILPENS